MPDTNEKQAAQVAVAAQVASALDEQALNAIHGGTDPTEAEFRATMIVNSLVGQGYKFENGKTKDETIALMAKAMENFERKA